MPYRSEIDGLRAIAVLAVILFHAGVAVLSGGFLGVDIFFVISGYLITSLIERDLELQRFSIINFYLRRVRRILPALTIMLVLTLPFAYMLMLPDDLENYGQSLVATVFSANNVLLYITQDYFAMESQFKPLIHTWSLGVEEQYYLAVPLLMAAVYLLGKRQAVKIIIAAVSTISLATCVWAQHAYPEANFYLILPRAWELGLGGLGTLFESRLRKAAGEAGTMLAGVGLMLMLAPLFTFDDTMALPGLMTALPVIGTVAVLVYARPDNIVGAALAWRPLVGIGLISYSAYLYHQPILAFIRIAMLEQPPQWLLLAVVPLIFGLAYLSWRFVEQPFRNTERVSAPLMLTTVAFGSTILCVVGLTFHFTSGFYANWPALADKDSEFGTKRNIAYNMLPFKLLNRPFGEGGPRVLVLGNSFARDFINMGIETGSLADHQISYGEIDECKPLPATDVENARHADFIVLGSGVNEGYIGCVQRLVRRLQALGSADITVLGTKGFGWNNNAVMLLPSDHRYSFRAKPLPQLVRDDLLARRAFPPSMYVSILGMISDREGRVPVFTPDRKFISQDRKHLTKNGARYIGGIVFQHPALVALSK